MRRIFDLWQRTARASARHTSDGELLDRFVRDGDDSAFAELVGRHGPLVYGTCRRLLPDMLDVEDVFQATFLVLVRRAGRLINQPLGPWLHRVAIWTARNLRRRNAVRLAAVRLLDEAAPQAPVCETAIDARLDVHQVLLALPGKYREPLVLCYLQGLTRGEAAARLGCPESTLSSQLGRGLALLRKRLGARDAAVLLAIAGSATVPPSIVAATVRSAVLFRTGFLSAAVSPTVAALTRGVLRMFWLRKLASLGVTLAALVMISAGVWLGSRDVPRANAQPPSSSATLPSPDKIAQEIERLKSRVHELEIEQELAKESAGTLELIVSPGQRPMEIKELDWRGTVLLRIWPTDVAALERFLVRSRGDKNGPRRLIAHIEPSHPADKVKEILAACRIAGYEPETASKGQPTARPVYVIEPPDVLRIEVKSLVNGVPLPLPKTIAGSYLVRPDGTVSLGTYGAVSVTGLTTSAAADAIRTHLLATKEIKDSGTKAECLIAYVVVESNNSKAFYVIVSGRDGAGESIIRLPWMENLAVVDVLGDEKIAQFVRGAQEIHVARKMTEVDGGPWQLLMVIRKGIMNGDVTTNYVILPKDRIYLNVKK